MQTSNYLIYNASAGSGKTFTLAKSYLKILLSSTNPDKFKSILAITFTNKAVGEMKQRVIDMLIAFSKEDIITRPNDMGLAICKELNIKIEDLHKRSKRIITHLLHNYAAFEISTIDGFTHRVIRTFAHDLKLSMNFEVELDQDRLLAEAVDRLISKAGVDRALTNILIDFAIEKTDDDKSWDITYDFNKIAALLLRENDLPYINTLKTKSLIDFLNLKTSLVKKLKELENNIVETAKTVIVLIEESGLFFNDFSSSYLPKYFDKLKCNDLNVSFGTVWQTTLLDGLPLYPKKVTDDTASIIDSIQPELAAAFSKTKDLVLEVKLKKAILKHITPLSVLNAIQKELNTLKNEQNKLLISEFNGLIHDEIKNQPTPFIYERLGEKFSHYFIDEFQDTSTLQWSNLQPLIDNALSSGKGSLMLVGDAKQAIYRWRGGDANQFIKLYDRTDQPFVTHPKVEVLDTNYRSFEEIINFNNGFFNYVSKNHINKLSYKNLYENATQKIQKSNKGYVDMCFLKFSNVKEGDQLYPIAVLDKINHCLKIGFEKKDICILVRKRKQGVAIANYLNKNNISISSSETLLLSNSKKVMFLVNFFNLLVTPNNETIKVYVLEFLAEWFKVEDAHHFIAANLKLPLYKVLKELKIFNVLVSKKELVQLPLYDLAETVIRKFQLIEESDSYVQYFLDEILNFSNKEQPDLSSFLNYFEERKNKLSIVSPQHLNAVKIMTIHQSKGLEFPVVIFPYADSKIYDEREPKVWYPLDEASYNGFSYALISANKDLQEFGEIGKELYDTHRSQLELDSMNILYVALTRAVQQLYIITKKDINDNGKVGTDNYASLFINFLMNKKIWDTNKETYSFGTSEYIKTSEEKEEMVSFSHKFISQSKESHQLNIISNKGLLWDTEQDKAIERGNLIHLILSKINTKMDIDFVFNEFLNSGELSIESANKLKKLLTDTLDHPTLNPYYSANVKVFNEVEIMDKTGHVFRLDRLVITPNNEAVVIDYKTGEEQSNHKQQLLKYATLVEELNYKVIKCLIVYLNETLKVVEV